MVSQMFNDIFEKFGKWKSYIANTGIVIKNNITIELKYCMNIKINV